MNDVIPLILIGVGLLVWALVAGIIYQCLDKEQRRDGEWVVAWPFIAAFGLMVLPFWLAFKVGTHIVLAVKWCSTLKETEGVE